MQQILVVMLITAPHSNTQNMSQIKMTGKENHTSIDWLSSELIIMDSEKSYTIIVT